MKLKSNRMKYAESIILITISLTAALYFNHPIAWVGLGINIMSVLVYEIFRFINELEKELDKHEASDTDLENKAIENI